MVHNHINFNQTHRQLKPRCKPELIIYSMYKFDVKLLGSNNSIGVTIWMSMEKKHLNTKAASPIPRLPCKFKKETL